MLDLRLPTGWFFGLAGVILLGLGIFSPDRARLSGANVNLYCGAFMLVFGACLLLLAWRSGHKRS